MLPWERRLGRLGGQLCRQPAASLAEAPPPGLLDGPFIAKPYVQLSTAAAAPDGTEQLSLLWHTPVGGHLEQWQVRWWQQGAGGGSPAPVTATSTLVDLPGCCAHCVWRCQLGGLRPGVRVSYEVERNGERAFSATAQPRKAADQPFHFAVAGDIGAGSPEQRTVAASLAALNPDFVVVPGDFMYSNGRVAEYWASDFFGVYGADAVDPSVGGPLLRSVPIFGGLGQHDSEVSYPTGHDM